MQSGGMGTSYVAGSVINFVDFPSYPVTLYAYDTGSCGDSEQSFELILTKTIVSTPITITADAKSKIYGDADPILTYQITSGSLISGDVLNGDLERELGEAVGIYEITQGDLDNTNYDITFLPSSFEITAAIPENIELPNVFTPNGDGVNDVFEIKDLEKKYPNFEIQFFDRNSSNLYKYKHNGDTRSTPIWWDGTYKGEKLPTGTYYFSLNYNNGDKEPKATWGFLNRE